MHLTEMEFIQFLAKSMAGEAHTTMINYLDLYRRKQMSITDIYLSLTDLYFTEMRPATALEKLQGLNDYNHTYSSLSEAHNGILYLANLASLASRSADRQQALCADYYQQALLCIMPKEYRALSSAAFEQCENLKRADLSPHEMLSCLNKLRHPIDDALRKTSSRIDRNKDQNQTLGRKGVKMVKNATDEKRGARPKKDADLIAPKSKDKRSASVKEVRASRGTPKKDTDKNGSKKKENNSPYDPLCKLCGSDGHPADNCELDPVRQRMVGRFPSRNCDGKLSDEHSVDAVVHNFSPNKTVLHPSELLCLVRPVGEASILRIQDASSLPSEQICAFFEDSTDELLGQGIMNLPPIITKELDQHRALIESSCSSPNHEKTYSAVRASSDKILLARDRNPINREAY